MTHRPKLIYLARRNPGLSREGFVPRWRRHGALGMSMPRWKNIWRYVHCDVLPQANGVDGVDTGYDGVGIVWHRSPGTRRAHRTDLSSQAIMEADELETFSGPVVSFCAFYDEAPIIDCGEAPAFKVIRFLRRRPDLTASEFRDEWAGVCADLVLRSPDVRRLLRRYVQNHRSQDETPGGGLAFELVEELSFDTLADAIATQEQIALNGPLRGALGRSVAEGLTVITNEVLLYQLADQQ